MSEYALPVQQCPTCKEPGRRLHTWRRGLPLDAECTSCGWYYTSAAHWAVLRALAKRPELGA